MSSHIIHPASPPKSTEVNEERSTSSLLLAIKRLFPLIGIAYVGITLMAGIVFLIKTSAMLTNDYWWPYFNSTADGAQMMMAFNDFLSFNAKGPINLTSTFYVHSRDLTGNTTQIYFSQSYARDIQYLDGLPIEQTISDIRKLKGFRVLYIPAEYCWVDFDRRWEMAHTQQRQKRCQQDFKENAAVYLESVLRNSNWEGFYATFGPPLEDAIFKAVKKKPGGREWYNSIQNPGLSIENEASLWKSKGMTKYVLHWQNFFNGGIKETISVKNVFGMIFPITLKLKPFASQWTYLNTQQLYSGFINDLWAIMPGNSPISGKSYVRGSDNYAYSNYTIMENYMNIKQFSTPPTFQEQLWNQSIGQYGAIDIVAERQPDSLTQFFLEGSRILRSILFYNKSAQQSYFNKTIPTWIPIPIPWRGKDFMYFGGSPICHRTGGSSYVQYFIDYESTCSAVLQYDIRLNPSEFLLSIIASDLSIYNEQSSTLASEIRNICSQLLRSLKCPILIMHYINFIKTYVPKIEVEKLKSIALTSERDVREIDIEFMQFAKKNGTPIFLRRSFLSTNNSAWNFWGWCNILMWASKGSEAISFKGDRGKITVLTSGSSSGMISNSNERIPRNLSVYFVRGAQYVTVILIGVAFLVFVHAIFSKGNISGLNMFEFNRVAGLVWVGRPLLILRAVVAISILSTGRLNIVQSGNFYKFETIERTWIEIILTSGEACWFTYVFSDLCCFYSKRYTRLSAALSSVFVWMITAATEFISPVQITAEANRVCENDGHVLVSNLNCVSGTVTVGNFERFMYLILLNIGCVSLCILAMKFFSKPEKIIPGCDLLLPGIACEMLVSNGWMHNHVWYLDKASSTLCGLVSFRWRKVSYLLDVKTWTLLFLRGTKVSAVMNTKCEEFSKSSKFNSTIQLSVFTEASKDKNKSDELACENAKLKKELYCLRAELEGLKTSKKKRKEEKRLKKEKVDNS